MDITCWNCKAVTKLERAAVEAAIAQMDANKVGFHDVACSSCGKVNRTPRETFEAGLRAFSAPTVPQKQGVARLGKEEKKEVRDAARKMKKGG